MKKIEEFKAEIVKLLAQEKRKPMSSGELAGELDLRGKDRKKIQQWLNELVLNGDIVCIRGDRYALGAAADLITGIVALARSGNGYIKGMGASAGYEVFVPGDQLQTALPGDKVVVRLDMESIRSRKTAPETRLTGTVIRLLERARHDLVGTLRSTGKFLYVVPVNSSYKQDFYVPEARGANLNDRVVIRFTAWANRHVNPEAEIIEVLGPADDPSVDTLAIIRNFDLRVDFPEEVLRDAEKASSAAERPGKRLDLRKELIITIDPVRARDFDDALSLTVDAQGNRELGVHIADVSHFVRPGSALDAEARERGNSIYFPDKVIPMLPEQLSNGVCSLRPDEDRLAFSAFLTVDAQSRVIGRRFGRSLIRSRLRMTYEQAMAVIEGRTPEGITVPAEVAGLIGGLHKLAQEFRRRRFAQYALDLEAPECVIDIAPNGQMTGIHMAQNDESHQLVEECMVAANEAVAFELANRGVPSISRLHEPPAEQKIDDLIQQLSILGYKPGDLHRPNHMTKFLKSIRNDPLAHHVRTAVLRSMKRAVYSAEFSGHFGLAKKHYAHFTSPIRRYPDLVVHRQLASWLERGEPGGGEGRARRGAVRLDRGSLMPIAEHCSSTEQIAEEAERTLEEIKKYRFLEEQVAQGKPLVYEAAVAAVTNFGMFVELIDLQIQGLVHVSAISDRFVRHDRGRNELRSGKQVFGVGVKVNVKVVKVDFDKRRVDFVLA